jgi:raffinose synthase
VLHTLACLCLQLNAQLRIENVEVDPRLNDGTIGAAIVSLNTRGSNAGFVEWRLGRPTTTSLVALSRFKLWWMRPCHVKEAAHVPPETQLLLGESARALPNGRSIYTVYVPLLDGPVKCSLKGAADDTIHVVAETGCMHTPVPQWVASLLIAVGEDPFALIEAAMDRVRK